MEVCGLSWEINHVSHNDNAQYNCFKFSDHYWFKIGVLYV